MQQGIINFPYKIFHEYSSEDMWTARIIVTENYYSKDNLDCLFLYFSKKNKDRSRRLQINVYTDEDKMYPNEWIDPVPFKTAWDACFYRQGEGALAGGGENEWYRYRPNLDEPHKMQTVVLRGMDPFAQKLIIGTWNNTVKGIQFRIIAFKLEDTFPQGTYFSLQALEEPDYWRSIMTIQKEDSSKPADKQLRVIDHQRAYGYLGWKFAVTLDIGDTWSVWDAESELPNWQCCDPNLIQDVLIDSDGTGAMTLNLSTASGEPRKLYTKNFGKSWANN